MGLPLASFAGGGRTEPLVITTAAGASHTFQVEIATTPQEQAMGLMFRQTLADDAGMLFVYKPPQEIGMWMKNTYISLDMIFIAADGRIMRIEHGTEPFSLDTISSGGDASAVLEVKAGTAARLALKPGDRIKHAFFGTEN